MLIAQIAVLLQSLVDDPFQLRLGTSGFSRTGGTGARFRIASKMTRRTFATERQRARRHLVEHRAEREQVRARVQFLGPHLLRRHVGDRAHRRARTGQVLLVIDRRRCVRRCDLRSTHWPVGVTLASPKSRILAWPRLVTKMFAGLMSRWTMPSACAASSASAISMARDSRASVSSGSSRDAVLQRHAIQKLHGDERLAVLLANFVDGADVGMVQRGGGLRLALEAARGLRVFGDVVGQKLQGDKAVERQCPRPCRPHPSRRRRASRRCGSARWFGRSLGGGLHTRGMRMVGRCHNQVKQLEVAQRLGIRAECLNRLVVTFIRFEDRR